MDMVLEKQCNKLQKDLLELLVFHGRKKQSANGIW